MLINLKAMLNYAEENSCAVGSFNVYNLESVQAVVSAAKAAQQPAIISFGEAYTKHAPLEAIAEIVKIYCTKSEIPFVLHLDHSKQFETIVKSIRAGFTSVMFDGSALPLAENIARSTEIVKIAHAADVSVEGELGYMNNEDGSLEPGMCLENGYTTVSSAEEYAAASGVDALAIAIGNAHGIYKGIPTLDFERLAAIEKKVAIPLVLHGSSGIPAEALRQAIELGIRKININTEVSTQGIKTAREFLAQNKDANTRFETMAKAAENAMEAKIREYMELFK